MREPLESLRELVAIESVSTDPAKKDRVRQAADYICKDLRDIGFAVKLIETSGHPFILAKLMTGAEKTLGFYAHYDVQPADPVDKWHSKPFELTELDGQLYGRGTSDDKIHVIQIIAAVKQALNQKSLKHNIVLIIEGEEEIGSANFEECVATVQTELESVQAFYILDSGVQDENTAVILYGLRGLLYYELKITGAAKDLHSGLYGNLAPNAATILTQFLGGIKNSNQQVTIGGFYDDVIKPSKTEMALLKNLKPSKTPEIAEIGTKDLLTPKNIPYYAANKTYPSFDVHGLYSGYIDPGSKTVIPSYANAKFSFRLVPDQDPRKIDQLFRSYLDKELSGLPITYELSIHSMDCPFVTDINNVHVVRTKNVFARHFKNGTLTNRSGGSIPAAEILHRLCRKPIIITGFTPKNSNLHGPDEHIGKQMFYKGIDTLTDLIS